jgi:hypothetical protein
LIKSKKDAENQRFDLFDKFIKQGISVTTYVMPDVKDIHATDFRCVVRNSVKDKKITENQIDKIVHFLPPKFPKSLIVSRFIPIFMQKLKPFNYKSHAKQSRHAFKIESKHRKPQKPRKSKKIIGTK